MNNLLSIIKFTISENMKKKVFVISTIFLVLVSAVIIALPTIINEFKGDDSKNTSSNVKNKSKKIVYYIDNNALKANNLNNIKISFTDFDFVKKKNKDKDKLIKEIKTKSEKSLIIFSEKNKLIEFEYYLKSDFSAIKAEILGKVIQKINTQNILSKYNVPDEYTIKMLNDTNYKVHKLGDKGIKNLIPSLLLVMITFFGIYYFGYGVATSVTSEKTSRVMEILVTSTKPSKIITGKCIGMGLLGLFQMGCVTLSGIISYQIFNKGVKDVTNILDFSAISKEVLLFNLLFFILGYSFYSMLNAMCAATVSKAEDVNSALMPVSMLALFGMYFGIYGTMYIPDSTVAVVSSILPISSPFSMPLRMTVTDVPVWQIASSIVLSIIFTAVSVKLSIKFYSLAILHYGTRLKLSSLFKMKL